MHVNNFRPVRAHIVQETHPNVSCLTTNRCMKRTIGAFTPHNTLSQHDDCSGITAAQPEANLMQPHTTQEAKGPEARPICLSLGLCLSLSYQESSPWGLDAIPKGLGWLFWKLKNKTVLWSPGISLKPYWFFLHHTDQIVTVKEQ